VVTLALETIDELGLDGLTLAEIAGRAGVKVPSLYKHIASLEVLRSAVATEATRELAQELRVAAIGVSRTAALESLAHAYRGYALRHPGRYAATQRAPLPGERARRRMPSPPRRCSRSSRRRCAAMTSPTIS
jgi:AcrR family transcriptional regulator